VTRQRQPISGLRIEHLCFTYRNSASPALARVDLSLLPREWRLLLGPTGAGKSTVVRCINGSLPRFYPGHLTGRILLGGRSIEGRSVPDLSREVGVVFQEFETQIFTTTCLMEVAFAMESRCLPPDAIRLQASDLLRRVGLSGFESRDPSSLSGGEKQRLVIASVLSLETPLLVLDEPASDLDPAGREEVYRLLRDLEQGAAEGGGPAILLVEHDLEGIPVTAGGTLLRQGSVARQWEGGDAEAMVELAGELRASGVRPSPIAELASILRGRARPRPGSEPLLRLSSLAPETFHRELQRTGWRLGAPAAADPTPRPATGAETLRCERLSHVYASNGEAIPALKELDLVVRRGEMLAILGANGSGKSTLGLHLAGLLVPTSGRALCEGEEVCRIPARRRAAKIGFVFQNPDNQIFASTVREETAFGPGNLGLTPREVDKRVGEALEAVGLTGLESTDPVTLTKGQRQRLAMASVLACEPATLIMDEPTTGLDLEEQIGVMSLLGKLNARGHTILIITHALWVVAEPVRRALVMVAGRIAADGAPRDLLTDEELMREAGLRMPDLARLSRLFGARLLRVQEWAEGLRPPA